MRKLSKILFILLLVALCAALFACSKGETTTDPSGITADTCLHSYNDGVVTTAPTCESSGIITYACTECGKKHAEKLNALGHELTHYSATAATCASLGNTEYWGCSRCGKYFLDGSAEEETESADVVIAKLPHIYTAADTAPNCTEKGFTTHTCTECGDSYVDGYVDALGHNFTYHPATAATCTGGGNSAYWYCSRCGKYYADGDGAVETTLSASVIPAKGHTLSLVAAKSATCTLAGNSRYWHCTVCGKYFSDEAAKHEISLSDTVVAALGHDIPAEWSHGADGHWHACANGCGEKSELAAHTWESAITTPATCTSDGVRTYTCTVCGETRNVAVSATGHSWNGGEITLQSTCTADGVKTYTCTVCGATSTEAVPATGHEYSDWSHDGVNHWHACTHGCGEITDTAAHVWNDGVVTTAAICTSSGIKTYTCTVCSATYTETIPAGSGHEWGSGVYTAGDCIHYGYTTYACSICHEDNVVYDTEYGAHDFEAHTCMTCGVWHDDSYIGYVSGFTGHGASPSDVIQLETEEEFVAFLEYMNFNYVTATTYYLPTYLPTKTQSTLQAEFNRVFDLVTCSTWVHSTGYASNGTYASYAIYNGKSGGVTYDMYAEKLTATAANYVQQDTFVDYDYITPTRGSSYDAFKYKSSKTSLTVKTSDQLFYALEHGFMPVATAGSSAESMLAAAKTVLRSICNDDMTDVEKLWAIYNWFVDEISYDYAALDIGTGNRMYDAWYLEGVFNEHKAVCDGIAKAFTVLAAIEGITCVRVVSDNHAWNKVAVDGDGDGDREWYIIDATWANAGVTSGENKYETFSADDFLFTDARRVSDEQIAVNYTSLAADTEYNVYSQMEFDFDSVTYDLVIESSAELNALLKRCCSEKNSMSTHTDYVTVEFLITFASSKTAAESAISSAISVANSMYFDDVNFSTSYLVYIDSPYSVGGYGYRLLLKW